MQIRKPDLFNLLKRQPPIDNHPPKANNSDMETQSVGKDNPSAISLQPSARTEASTPTYLFYHCDHLGTVRLITDNSGAVVSRHDYEPFGVEIAPTFETAGNTHQFTGHERDANTGYDYMHYRSYGSNIGRFMKPDNVTGNPLNPQSWNLYSYVRGNPVNFNDPTGHMCARDNTTVNTAESGIAGDNGETLSLGGWNDCVSDTTSNLNHKLTLNRINAAPGDPNFIGPVLPQADANVHVYTDSKTNSGEKKKLLEHFQNDTAGKIADKFNNAGITIAFSYEGDIDLTISNSGDPARASNGGLREGTLNVILSDRYTRQTSYFMMGKNHTGFVFLNGKCNSYIAREEFFHAFGVCRWDFMGAYGALDDLGVPNIFNAALSIPYYYYVDPLLNITRVVMKQEANKYVK